MTSMSHAIKEHLRIVDSLWGLLPQAENAADRLADCLRGGGKILWMGNGGSAADSQHLAAELVGRLRRERPALASIALTTDTSILTAVGNDYGFENIFGRQVEALCTAQDALVAISTSGRSKNIIAALEVGKRIGAYRLGFSGAEGGDMTSLCDDCLMVPSDDTCRIQEAHILLGHIMCDRVEASLAGASMKSA